MSALDPDEVENVFCRALPHHSEPNVFEQYGSTWVECTTCGAQWSVHETITVDGEDAFTFKGTGTVTTMRRGPC